MTLDRSRPQKHLLRKRFLSDDHGAVAITFALCSIVLFGLVALAVDASNATRARHALQLQLDQAALAAARVYADNSSDPQQTAQAFFNRNWARLSLAAVPSLAIQTSRDVDTGDHVVRVTTNATVAMSFARVLGYNTITMAVTAEARVGMPFTEIAMALDTTGSMTGSKLDDLKAAAKRLVESAYLMPQGRDKIKFSLVPFGQYVNVGLGYRNEAWMDVPPDGTFWDANTCWDDYPIVSQTNCRQATCTSWNDGVPSDYSCQQCDTVYGAPQRMCGANITNVWNGCVGSRSYPMNMQTVTSASSRIPGLSNIQCAAPLMRLTNSEAQIRSAIENMVPLGETYVPSGLEWGWRVLSTDGPFNEARPKTGSTAARKILLLMTDGANTRSPTYPAHDNWDAATSNQLTSELCTKAKADGVEIFTVAFEVSDNSIKNILQQCAFEQSRFYDAANRSALFDAFDAIAKHLVAARISR